MQFDQLEFPSQPATDTWLRETNARDDVAISVPLAVKEDGVPWILGVMVLSDEAISLFYHNLHSWNLFSEYSFEHEFMVYNDDLLEPGVGLIRNDARVVRRLASKLAEKLLDITGLAFSPYANPPMAEKIETLQEKCDCSSISESQVRAGPGLSAIDEERIYMCAECMEIHGTEYEKRPVRKEKAFDANWVLGGETADGFVDTEDNAEYLLYSSGESVEKLEHVIALMSAIGGSISHSFSNYVPSEQQALVYVKDDVLAGYLTWATEVDGRPSLQQLFTREVYRNEGVASTLIDTWAANYCDHDRFYVEEPNEKSRALLKKCGYVDEQPEAVEHFLLRGLANDWEDGMERADSVSSLQNAV